MDDKESTDLNLWIEQEILNTHRKESRILSALDSSYGFNYPSRLRKKRPHEGITSFPDFGAKTEDRFDYGVDEKRLCKNGHSSQPRKNEHEK